MEYHYTSEKNVQILIALLKAHNVRKVIASPGTCNLCLVASVQQDSYFQVYSCVDERSAAYMACGMSAESGEPVVLTCTGATASRNYVPGLTEAFYRKLPVIAVTITQHTAYIGQNIPQFIDRSSPISDIVKHHVQIAKIYNEDDRWACEMQINRALLELTRNGGGPVNIDLITTISEDFSCTTLPDVKVIHRYGYTDVFPEIKKNKVAIFVGAHKRWDRELIESVEKFCEKYNGVVLCDKTSNYDGKYSVQASLITMQTECVLKLKEIELMVHIGDVSGAYIDVRPSEVWRVNPDGEVRDTYRKLTNIYSIQEKEFFERYSEKKTERCESMSYFKEWSDCYSSIESLLVEVPFSNIWVAQQASKFVPENSVVHLGILNSLRSWNFFETNKCITFYSNTGGFGIDGAISTLIGSALSNTKIHYGIVGDLAFFYDMNSIGNRHFPKNIRIVLINNGIGTEFKNYTHPASKFEADADKFMAARGHFGNKSQELVKGYVESLGFMYIPINCKEDFLKQKEYFFSPSNLEMPIIMEIFTDSENESTALRIINETLIDKSFVKKKELKNVAKKLLGKKGVEAAKKILNKKS